MPSYDPNIPGGGLPTPSPEEASYAEERKRKVYELAAASKEEELAVALREAARKAAADEAANVAAMNEAAGQKNEYYQRADGSYARLPEGYTPAPTGVVVPRVLGAAPARAGAPVKNKLYEAQRFDEEQVPIAPQIPGGRVGEKILGPSERAIEDIARPQQEEGSGIRFAIGGKWYEQTPSGYAPVDQVKTDHGVEFNQTGPSASPEVMADIRQQVRSQGAFGKELPQTSGGAGGFSPSPKFSDVAVLPDSAIEDIAGKTQMRGYEKVLGDLERIPDEALPAQMRGLGLTRQDVRQLMLAQASHPARETKPGVGPEALARLQKIEDHYQTQKQAIEAFRDPQQKEDARARLERWHADARRTETGWDEKPQLGI
jgi:hypothetical protein